MSLQRDVQSSCDEDDDADDDLILQKCIRDGIQSTTRSNGNSLAANASSSTISQIERLRSLPTHVQENPIGMLRKGGNAYIETAFDETNRSNVEDSPRNFSVVPGLSELPIATNTPAVFNTLRYVWASNHRLLMEPMIHSKSIYRLPNTQENVNHERSLTPTSVDSEEDRILLKQVRSMLESIEMWTKG